MSEQQAHPSGYAAPPDDGGDTGAFSKPDDLLIVCPTGRPHPELSIDSAKQRPPRAGAGQTLIMLIMLILAIPILWAYCVRG